MQNQTISKILLIGPGAEIKDIASFAQTVLQLPCELFDGHQLDQNKKYHIDDTEFLLAPEEYSSFNDFFTRKLKSQCRPIAQGDNIAILPADGRYLVFPSFPKERGVWVKNKNFSLPDLLLNQELVEFLHPNDHLHF